MCGSDTIASDRVPTSWAAVTDNGVAHQTPDRKYRVCVRYSQPSSIPPSTKMLVESVKIGKLIHSADTADSPSSRIQFTADAEAQIAPTMN